MTIPFAIPFGRRRLVVSLDLVLATPVAPTAPARTQRAPNVPAAYEATDAELARLNAHSAAAEERRHWESQAVLLGLRSR